MSDLFKKHIKKLNVICFYYPGGAGGKTILNALSLADNAVMQDLPLALQQLNGKLSQKDKFNTLINRLHNPSEVIVDEEWKRIADPSWGSAPKSENEYLALPVNIQNEIEDNFDNSIRKLLNKDDTGWQDLFLGDSQLYGDLEYFASTYKSSKYIFIVAHSKSKLAELSDIFTIKHLIQFINYEDIVISRNYKLNRLNYTIEDDSIKWDATNVESDKYIIKIKELYDLIGLTNFNEYYITEYIEAWKEVVLK